MTPLDLELHHAVRVAVIATHVLALVLLGVRWRRWVEASQLWRMVGLALAVSLLGTLVGTVQAVAVNAPYGHQIVTYLVAGVVACYALTPHRSERGHHPR